MSTLIERLESKLLAGEALNDQQLLILNEYMKGGGKPAQDVTAAKMKELDERAKSPHLTPADRISLGYERNKLEEAAQ